MEITEIKLLVESELGLGYRSQLVGVDDQAIVHGLPLLLRVVGISSGSVLSDRPSACRFGPGWP